MSKIDLSNARIMITNDDGYNSAGIKLLKEISEEFSNDVWIVAPEFEKSGASHALSFHNPNMPVLHTNSSTQYQPS